MDQRARGIRKSVAGIRVEASFRHWLQRIKVNHCHTLLLVKLDQGLESAQIAFAGALGLGEEFDFVRQLG